MLPPEAKLVLWYLGVGYLVFLAWVGTIHDLINHPAGTTPSRARALVTAGVLAGLVHPAFALAAYDVTRQLQHEGDPLDRWPAPLGTAAVTVAAISTITAATLFVVSFG